MLHKVRLLFYVPLYVLLRRSSCREAAERDAIRSRWANPDKLRSDRERIWLTLEGLSLPQVRSIFYHRLCWGTRGERLACAVARRLVSGLTSLELQCSDIGSGLVIEHGHGSVLWAESIGRDCRICQQVTLGNKGGFPKIGDRVTVWPGAIILGAITVGDEAEIGAGAVVLRDVPPGAVVAGVPARVISTRPVSSCP